MGLAFHPTTGLTGVFRVRNAHADSFVIGRIVTATPSRIVAEGSAMFPSADLIFCGTPEDAAILAAHLNDLARAYLLYRRDMHTDLGREIARITEEAAEIREAHALTLGSAQEAYLGDITTLIQSAVCGELEPLEVGP